VERRKGIEVCLEKTFSKVISVSGKKPEKRRHLMKSPDMDSPVMKKVLSLAAQWATGNSAIPTPVDDSEETIPTDHPSGMVVEIEADPPPNNLDQGWLDLARKLA
jgi:hypothetical protein